MTILVPRLSRGTCGVSDFGFLTAAEMAEHAPKVLAPARLLGNYMIGKWSDGSTVLTLRGHTGSQNGPVVIVNYSPWGYARRGSPIGLLVDLAWFRLQNPGSRVLLVLHEIWSTSDSCWNVKKKALEISQRLVVGAIARLSDSVITNCEAHAKRMWDELRAQIDVYTVPSNITRSGSRAELDKESEARYRWVVFGRANTRRKALMHNCEMLGNAAREGLVGSVITFGSGNQAEIREEYEMLRSLSPDVVIKCLGPLENSEISRRLLSSDFLLTHYASEEYSKSGTIAAALHHGVIPIRSRERTEVRGPSIEVDGPLARLENTPSCRLRIRELSRELEKSFKSDIAGDDLLRGVKTYCDQWVSLDRL